MQGREVPIKDVCDSLSNTSDIWLTLVDILRDENRASTSSKTNSLQAISSYRWRCVLPTAPRRTKIT